VKLPRQLVPVLLLGVAALAALAVGYWNIRPASFMAPPLVDDPGQPDFFMQNAHIITLDEQGQVKHELTTPHTRHYQAQDSTHLEQPLLVFAQNRETPPWTLEARRGLVTEEGDRIDLFEEVQLEQPATARRLQTSLLTIFPARDYAETDQSVRLEAPRQLTTADGMQLHYQEGRLELLSNVRGEHEPR